MPKPVVEVRGVKELNRALRKLDGDLPNALKVGFLAIARASVPSLAASISQRTGTLAGTVRAGATKKTALVRIGKASVPYAGSAIFGGYPPGRPYDPQGRGLFAAARGLEPTAFVAANHLIDEVARKAGLL